MAMAWSASRLFGALRGPVAAGLLLTQFAVLAYAAPGRADHHVFLMVAIYGWCLEPSVDPASGHHGHDDHDHDHDGGDGDGNGAEAELVTTGAPEGGE